MRLQLNELTLLISFVGLVAAVAGGLAADGVGPWRKELPRLAVGLNAIALVGSVVAVETTSTHTAVVLVLVGASLAAFGVLARNLGAVEGALLAWLASFLVLIGEHLGVGLHAAVIASSVVMLGVVELERVRREIDDLPRLDLLDQVEWALMLAPLVLAAADMFGSLWFGPVLLAEGLALAAWGTMTEVRRRALLGVGAMVLAIVLSLLLPALNGLIEGLAGGTWLAVGAIAAAVSILAGSTIEKQRHRIGRRLASVADILERWS